MFEIILSSAKKPIDHALLIQDIPSSKKGIKYLHWLHRQLPLHQNVFPIAEQDDIELLPTSPFTVWDDIATHRLFFRDIAPQQLNILQQQDWYRIHSPDFGITGSKSAIFSSKVATKSREEPVGEGWGALPLYSFYQFSINRMVETIYPEYEWHPWQFEENNFFYEQHLKDSTPPTDTTSINTTIESQQDDILIEYWNDSSTHKKYFDWLSSTLQITTPSQWESVGIATVIHHGGKSLLLEHYGGSLKKALSTVYPNYRLERMVEDKVATTGDDTSIAATPHSPDQPLSLGQQYSSKNE